MLTRPLHHLRRNVIAYLALFLALGAGGYAKAATKTKTITVCADKRTSVLHLKNHGRCSAVADAGHVESKRSPRGARGTGPCRGAGSAGSQRVGDR